MSQELLSFVLFLLAVLGGFGIVRRLGRAMLRLGLAAAEATAASGLAEVSERRGDITAFIESRQTTEAFRRARRRTLALVAAYLLLLIVPPIAGYGREVYAACALLWLLPNRPIRSSLVTTREPGR